jgi:hypothetical protein
MRSVVCSERGPLSGAHRKTIALTEFFSVCPQADIPSSLNFHASKRLTMKHDAIDAMASFRFSAGITWRWHKPAELPLHKLSKSDGCAVL